MNDTKIVIRAKTPDHYERKVHCPKCRARLMDIHAEDIEYKSVLAQIGQQMTFDFSMKCPKCRSIVGISFDRIAPKVAFRTVGNRRPQVDLVCSDPMPYRIILLNEEVGA